MKNDINRKAIFLFIVVLVIALIAGITWYLLSVREYAIYQIYTEDPVSGLIADAPVEFHGVEIGKVKSIDLVNPHVVSILLSINKTAPITAATVATITARGLATRGFTGYVYISLEDAGTAAHGLIIPPGKQYPVIPTTRSKFVTLDTTLSQMNETVQRVTQLLQSVLDKNTIMSLKQSLDSLQQVTKMLAENTKKLNSIIINTEQASNQFKPLLESSNRTVKALQMQILPQTYKTLSTLDSLSSSLANVASKISRNPSILIRGAAPPSPGPGEAK
jgi:phospholipid/cholesterol/gamma-HCH transport system substrate-binding protein